MTDFFDRIPFNGHYYDLGFPAGPREHFGYSRKTRMNPNKVQFSGYVNVHEVERVDESWYQDLFYQNADLERFQTNEKQRWERAYAKRLKKLAEKNSQDISKVPQDTCDSNCTFRETIGKKTIEMSFENNNVPRTA
jgi:hypothetical protein